MVAVYQSNNSLVENFLNVEKKMPCEKHFIKYLPTLFKDTIDFSTAFYMNTNILFYKYFFFLDLNYILEICLYKKMTSEKLVF